MNALVLKVLAVIFMLIDHVGATLFRDAALNLGVDAAQGFLWMRAVGRIAFPLFAFLIAEGCAHTRDIKKYIARLTVFAFLAEIPFDQFSGRLSYLNTGLFDPETQNIMFTLALGALAIYFYKKAWEERAEAVLWACACAATLPAVVIIGGEYSLYGVLAVILPYIFRPKKPGDADVRIIGSRAAQAIACVVPVATMALGSWHWLYFGLLGAPVLAMLYNGRPGPRRGKYLFYAFYPVHLLVLAGALYLITATGFSFVRW